MSEPLRDISLSKLPLLMPMVGLIAGIALTGVVYPTYGWQLPACFGVLALIMLLLRWFRLMLAGLMMLVGSVLLQLSMPPVYPAGRVLDCEADVVWAVDYGLQQSIVVEIPGGYRLGCTLTDYPQLIMAGDRVRLRGVSTDALQQRGVPDMRDGRNSMLTRRLSGRLIIRNSELTIVAEAGGFRGWLGKQRQRAREAIEDSGVSGPTGRFLCAILLGDNSIDEDLRDEFARAGVAHVLALSGTHVAVVAFLVAMIFFPVTMIGRKKIANLLIILVLWGYVVFTGASVSVVRAVVMATIVMVGEMMDRPTVPLNSLCAAALIILAVNPSDLFAVGFQLSFVAVAGILMFTPIFKRLIVKLLRKGAVYNNRLMDLILLPITAMMVTAPVSVYYFHVFPVWFFVANILIAIVLPLCISGGALLMTCSLAGLKTGWICAGLDRIYELIISTSNWAANLPGEVPAALLYPHWWQTAAWYVFLLMLWWALAYPRRVITIAAAAWGVLAVAVSYMGADRYPQQEWYVMESSRELVAVVRTGHDVRLITDASEKHHSELLAKAANTLDLYLGRRNATLKGIAPSGWQCDMTEVQPGFWRLGNRKYLIAGAELADYKLGMKYAGVIVSRAYKGDADSLRTAYPADLYVLSPTIYSTRRARLLRELRAAGCKVSLTLPTDYGLR